MGWTDPRPRCSGRLVPLAVLACLLIAPQLPAREADNCFVCGAPLVDGFYSIEDKVTLEKQRVCKECEASLPRCFVCGLPVRTNAPGWLELPDGRLLCARDAGTAVLSADEGTRVCRDVRDGLDRLLSRFMAFPEKNVTVRMVDRVSLLELFKSAGKEDEGPNVLGVTQTGPGKSGFEHRISVLGGMPLSFFKATCAHEYTHTWLNENLSPARHKALSKDAEEGFCEFVAYVFMDSLDDAAAKARLLRNTYTHGQIDLFVAARNQFGFNDVLEWMKSGADDRLSADDPGRVEKLRAYTPSPALTTPVFYGSTATAPPRTLALKAIFWDQTRPTALINNRTFGVNEEGIVHLSATNVTVRCLAIGKNSVRVRIAGSGQDQDLSLKSR